MDNDDERYLYVLSSEQRKLYVKLMTLIDIYGIGIVDQVLDGMLDTYAALNPVFPPAVPEPEPGLIPGTVHDDLDLGITGEYRS